MIKEMTVNGNHSMGDDEDTWWYDNENDEDE